MNKLRLLGVTSVYTLEVPDIIGHNFRMPLCDLVSLVDNLVLGRYIELRSRLYQLISVLTVCVSDLDPSLYGYVTSSNGLRIEETYDFTEGIMAGVLRRKDDVTSLGQTAPVGRDD